MNDSSHTESAVGQPVDDPQIDNSSSESRREAMKKLGKYAAYTAPVMLALVLPKNAPAQTGSERP